MIYDLRFTLVARLLLLAAILCLPASCVPVHAQEHTWREATPAEMTAGTAGAPVVVTPRRSAAVAATNTATVTAATSLLTPNGAIWRAQNRPMQIYYFMPFATPQENEDNVVTNMWMFITNGTVANVLAAGGIPCVWLDVGGNYARNTSWSYMLTNWGSLTWNATLYPHGYPWLCNFLHTNGVKVMIGYYAETNQLIPGATEFLADEIDGHRFYTNGVGTYPTTSRGQYWKTILTPETLRSDLSQMRFWGFDYVSVNDGQWSAAHENQVVRLINDALLQPCYPNGFPRNGAGTNGYYNYDRAGLIFTLTNQFNTDLDARTLFGTPMGFQEFCSLSGLGEKYSYGSDSSLGRNQVMYDNFANASSFSGVGYDGPLRRYVRDFPKARYLSEGNYCLLLLQASVMPVETIVVGGFSEVALATTLAGAGASQYTYLTNMNNLRLIFDPLQNVPILGADFGTNIGSIFYRKVSGGKMVVGMFNTSATITTNLTATWKALDIQTNTIIHVYRTSDLNDFGKFTNSFSYLQAYGGGAAPGAWEGFLFVPEASLTAH